LIPRRLLGKRPSTRDGLHLSYLRARNGRPAQPSHRLNSTSDLAWKQSGAFRFVCRGFRSCSVSRQFLSPIHRTTIAAKTIRDRREFSKIFWAAESAAGKWAREWPAPLCVCASAHGHRRGRCASISLAAFGLRGGDPRLPQNMTVTPRTGPPALTARRWRLKSRSRCQFQWPRIRPNTPRLWLRQWNGAAYKMAGVTTPAQSAPKHPDPGLCRDCRHARMMESDRGSVFLLCKLSFEDARFPKYPRLPVRECSGYRPKTADASGKDT